MAAIERHPEWLARTLDEDFGIDAEAEYMPVEARGDILKLQFKSTVSSVARDKQVRFSVGRKYLEYARKTGVRVDFPDPFGSSCWRKGAGVVVRQVAGHLVI